MILQIFDGVEVISPQLFGADSTVVALDIHAVLYDKYLRYQMLILTHRGEETIEEHRKVFEAALARDIDTAANTLKIHIDKGLEHSLAAF